MTEIDQLHAHVAQYKADNAMLREALKDADNELDWEQEARAAIAKATGEVK
jgi:hypothetical protein